MKKLLNLHYTFIYICYKFVLVFAVMNIIKNDWIQSNAHQTITCNTFVHAITKRFYYCTESIF